MTIIEGIGDEVLYCMCAAVVFVILAIAWSSTSVTDGQTFIRTAVLVIERRRRSYTNNNTTTSTAVNNNTETRNRVIQQQQQQQPEVRNEPQPAPQRTPPGSPLLTNRTGNSGSPSTDESHRSDEGLRHRRTTTAGDVAEKSDDEVKKDGDEPESKTGENVTMAEPQLDDGHIRVRLKFLNETQRLVEARLVDQLGHFKQQHFGAEIGSNKIVRLIFNGQLLQRDNETLQFHGLFDNCVVHCHISPNAAATASSPASSVGNAAATAPLLLTQSSPQVELDLSRLMLPLFGLILGLIWCCRIQYRQYFNATSTFALLAITALFVVSVAAICLPTRNVRTATQQQPQQ